MNGALSIASFHARSHHLGGKNSSVSACNKVEARFSPPSIVLCVLTCALMTKFKRMTGDKTARATVRVLTDTLGLKAAAVATTLVAIVATISHRFHT